jgi:hypothetical protein
LIPHRQPLTVERKNDVGLGTPKGAAGNENRSDTLLARSRLDEENHTLRFGIQLCGKREIIFIHPKLISLMSPIESYGVQILSGTRSPLIDPLEQLALLRSRETPFLETPFSADRNKSLNGDTTVRGLPPSE